MLLSSMDKGGRKMLLMNPKNNVAPDKADTPIYCKCGGEVFLSLRLFQLWLNNGIKFRCPKCKSFISSKRVA